MSTSETRSVTPTTASSSRTASSQMTSTHRASALSTSSADAHRSGAFGSGRIGDRADLSSEARQYEQRGAREAGLAASMAQSLRRAPETGTPPTASQPSTRLETGGLKSLAGRVYDNPNDRGRSMYGHSGGIWLNNAGGNPQAVSQAVRNAGDKAPVFVQYSIPGRDNGGASRGGAGSAQQYLRGVEANARAIGKHNAVVVLEPDALSMGKSPALIKQALETYKKHAPNANVLLDAGHSQWTRPGDMARMLKSAGIDKADGFSTNVSNYHSNSGERAYGDAIRKALGPGYANKRQVIDTSRNKYGDGLDSAGRVTWGDPVRARNGPVATGLSPGTAIDSRTSALWVKPPGEADGRRFGAGQFVGTRLVQRG